MATGRSMEATRRFSLAPAARVISPGGRSSQLAMRAADGTPKASVLVATTTQEVES